MAQELIGNVDRYGGECFRGYCKENMGVGQEMKAEDILGKIGFLAGLTEQAKRLNLHDLLELYDENRLRRTERGYIVLE